jgi:hypothetical protein
MDQALTLNQDLVLTPRRYELLRMLAQRRLEGLLQTRELNITSLAEPESAADYNEDEINSDEQHSPVHSSDPEGYSSDKNLS